MPEKVVLFLTIHYLPVHVEYFLWNGYPAKLFFPPPATVLLLIFCLFFLTARGDYRTGKRLNMRKVIPYVASQFRKDKIWLRRTKPSKRQYQICLALDDSASMVDNHSKQVKQKWWRSQLKSLIWMNSAFIFHASDLQLAIQEAFPHLIAVLLPSISSAWLLLLASLCLPPWGLLTTDARSTSSGIVTGI